MNYSKETLVDIFKNLKEKKLIKENANLLNLKENSAKIIYNLKIEPNLEHLCPTIDPVQKENDTEFYKVTFNLFIFFQLK